MRNPVAFVVVGVLACAASLPGQSWSCASGTCSTTGNISVTGASTLTGDATFGGNLWLGTLGQSIHLPDAHYLQVNSGGYLTMGWAGGDTFTMNGGNGQITMGRNHYAGGPPLTVVGGSGQTGNIFQVIDSSGNSLFGVGSAGNVSATANLNVVGAGGHGYLAVGDGNPYVNSFFDGTTGSAGFGSNLYFNGSNWVYANTAGYGGLGAAWSMRPDAGVQLMFTANGANPATPYTTLTALRNGNVGIGTTSPTGLLSLFGGSDGVNVANLGSSGSHTSQGSDYYSSVLSIGVPINVGTQAIDIGEGSRGGGLYMLENGAGTVQLSLSTRALSTVTPRVTVNQNGNVGIGTTNPQHLLHVAGAIGAEEVIVSSTGADYVFDPGYRLAPLAEVSDYVQANHHLPDIPSAKEVEEKGVSLGDMQSKLLAKIEELTLHMIEANKRIDDLERRNRQLEVKVERTNP